MVIAIFGLGLDFKDEQALLGWGMFAIITELLAIGISGYALAAIAKSAKDLPRTAVISLRVMFVILALVSTLGLLADIGKVMKGVSS